MALVLKRSRPAQLGLVPGHAEAKAYESPESPGCDVAKNMPVSRMESMSTALPLGRAEERNSPPDPFELSGVSAVGE